MNTHARPKSYLGEITAFTITTPDLAGSLRFYEQLGFSEVMRADWPFPWIQVSDGVVLMMLRKDEQPYLALTYYVKNIDKVVKALEAKGIVFLQKAKVGDMVKRYLFQSPDGLNISLVSIVDGFKQPKGPGMLAMPQEDYFKPERYVNKICGLFGELAHPVANLETSIAYWKLLGFEVMSQHATPYPWAIMSDGLSVVGLHETSSFDYPALTYFAADMQDKLTGLRKKNISGLSERGGGNMVLATPEKQHIFLFQLGSGAETKTATMQLPVIETDRLWLKELNPEVMQQLYSSQTDEQIMEVLGINEAQLATEQEQFQKGLTTYRLSFKNFVMVEKATGKTVGRCGYHTWYLQHARAEIGYAMIDESAKRKGLMTEAIKAIVQYGFEQMGLNRIEAMTSPENEASLRILRGLGFIQEGHLRAHYFKNNKMEDSLVLSLLRSDLEGKK